MKRNLLLTAALFLTVLVSYAQKGQIWPTLTRQDFEFNDEAEITQEYAVEDYFSYYLFINNNEFIHCTKTITSLYKIIKREESDKFTDYTVVSEVGNTYTFRFAADEMYIAIYSDKGFGIYCSVAAPYETKVFDNLNK